MKSYGKNLARIFNTTWDGAFPWPDLERMIGRHIERGGAWLDFACGTGDLLARAQSEGFEVAGADTSRAQLQYARETCPEGQFVQGKMQTVRLGRKFDVITCLGDSIHHLPNRRELKQFFANAKRHLKPDGVFLFDFNTFREVPGDDSPYTGSVWTYRNPGEFVCVEFVYDDLNRTSEWITTGFTKEGKLYRRFEEKHTLRGHPIEEVDEALDQLGLRARKYDNQSKSMRPRKNSNALYFVCSR